MKTLITLSILIGTLLTNVHAQSVTFQSYMSTVKWAESVTLNGNVLNESSSGVFDIPPGDVVPGTNIIEFQSVVAEANGVTTLDLVLIKRALFGISSLDIDAVIPADFDKSGYIGVNDIANLYTHILGIEEGVENAFIHPSIDLASLDPFDFGTDVYKFEFDGADLVTTDFTFDVYIHGDVNKTAMFAPESIDEVEVRQSNASISIDDIELSEGSTYEVPFIIESNKLIEAFQYGTSLDGIVIIDIKTNDENFDLESHITNDQARFLAVSDVGINIVEGSFTVTANRDGMLSELLSQETSFFDEIVYTDLTTGGLELEFRATSAIGGLTFEDIVLSPNPAVEEVTISFPEVSSNTTLYISNAQGQLISTKIVTGSFATIQKDELMASGVYIITVEQEGQTVQKKFVML